MRKVDIVQKCLQCPQMSFKDAHEDLEALATWLQENRDISAQEAVTKSIELCNKWEVEIEIKRVRRKKCMPGELARDEPLTPQLDMKRKLFAAVDRLVEEVLDFRRLMAVLEFCCAHKSYFVRMNKELKQFARTWPKNMMKTYQLQSSVKKCKI